MHSATIKAHTSTGIISTTTALNWVVQCIRVANQRRTLAKLSWSALEDIGISDAQAMREARKPFWA